VGTETSPQLIARNRINIYAGVAVRLPLICYCSTRLGHDKEYFLMIRALGDYELLLYSLEPIHSFHGILSLRESGGVSS
jgi:hypothetical protein